MSKTDNLRRHAFLTLNRVRGRKGIDEITDLLIDAGVIPDGPEALRRMQLHEARKLLKLHRDAMQREGRIEKELAHFTEKDAEGNRVHYWKPVGKATEAEGMDLIHSYDERIGELRAQRQRYCDYFVDRFGEEFQQRLDFGDDAADTDDAEPADDGNDGGL